MANKNAGKKPANVAEEQMEAKAETAAEAVAEEPMEAKAETAAEAVAEEPLKPEAVDNASGIWCYIGPNLRGLINHNKIFRGTRAEVLKQAERVLEAYPEAQRLIVAGENLTRDRERAGTPGNAIYEIYKALEKKEKEGRKE